MITLLTTLVLAAASAHETRCDLRLTGEPVDAFTRAAIARALPRATGVWRVEHLTLAHVLARADVEIKGRVAPDLAWVVIRGVPMFVRPAGPIARAVLMARLGEDAHEHYAFDRGTLDDYARSTVLRSLNPEGLGRDEVDHGFACVRAPARPVAGDETLRLTHEHPGHECLVWSEAGTARVIDFPLNRFDYEAGLALSTKTADVTFVISAVARSGLEYFAAFRNGHDASLAAARAVLRMDRAAR